MKEKIKRGLRVMRALVTDARVPAPVRWLLLLALLPIPGPVDEVAGGLAVAWIAWRRAEVLADALNMRGVAWADRDGRPSP